MAAQQGLTTLRRGRWIAVLCILATACPKRVDPAPSLPPNALEEAPRLPSPRAGSYGRAIAQPSDPIVRSIIGNRRWDASLAGTAAGLALAAASDSGGFSRRELREAAWQAGYPWPILSVGVWKADEKSEPPPGVRTWLSQQPAERDIGLVRARGLGKDTWVGVAGEVQIPLGVLPREVTLGHELVLPAHPGATWLTSDGLGALRTGSLDQKASIALDTSGEWLIQIVDAEGDLARFTLYVNDKAPRVGVLPVLEVAVANVNEAHTRAWQLIDIVRDAYGSLPIQRDTLMRNAAERARDSGNTDLQTAAAKFAPAPHRASGWSCVAPNLEDCIDQVLWDPKTRLPFVDPAPWSGGIAIRMSPGRVEVFGLMAADD
jgi:hypothetical protein